MKFNSIQEADAYLDKLEEAYLNGSYDVEDYQFIQQEAYEAMQELEED